MDFHQSKKKIPKIKTKAKIKRNHKFKVKNLLKFRKIKCIRHLQSKNTFQAFHKKQLQAINHKKSIAEILKPMIKPEVFNHWEIKCNNRMYRRQKASIILVMQILWKKRKRLRKAIAQFCKHLYLINFNCDRLFFLDVKCIYFLIIPMKRIFVQLNKVSFKII